MRIAFSTLPASGHLNPMTALAGAVRERGHDVYFVGLADCEAMVRASGFDFHAIAREEFPVGHRRALEAQLSRMHGLAGMRFTLDRILAVFEAELREGPRVLRETGAEAAVLDEVPGGLTPGAKGLGLPVIQVANALPIQIDHHVPPPFTPWAYGEGWAARARNRVAWEAFRLALRPFFRAAREHPREVNARIAQVPAAFDFPVAAEFHRTGPFHDVRWRAAVAFPWERLTGAALIYASMGTVQNGAAPVFRTIAEACSGLECQLVMSVGENVAVEDVGAADCIVVRDAPQLELLRRAALCVTYAGLNTALESLAAGVPMVAIPITNDQPGVAARIAYSGTGVVVRYRELSAGRLRGAVRRVLGDAKFAENAGRVKLAIHEGRGLERAVGIIEEEVMRRR